MDLEVISHAPEGEARPTPLLFVHGAWHAAWCWEEHFLPYFSAQGYEVHALSLRGHGKSSGSQRNATIADYVADVAQVAVTLHQPPLVLGHSMGGFVTQHYLATHRAPGGVLMASLPPWGALRSTIKAVVEQPLDALRATFGWSLYPFVDTPAKTRKYFFSATMTNDELLDHFERIQAESYRALLDFTLLKRVRAERVRMPVLVLGGADDAVFNVQEVQGTARAYHTEAQIFPHTAHDVMLEASWQAVADAILGWLRERGL